MRPHGGRGERAAADAHRTQRDQHRVAVHLIQLHTQNALSATRMERVSWASFTQILHIRTISMVAALGRQRGQQRVAVHLPFRQLAECKPVCHFHEFESLAGVKEKKLSLWARSSECAIVSNIRRGYVWRVCGQVAGSGLRTWYSAPSVKATPTYWFQDEVSGFRVWGLRFRCFGASGTKRAKESHATGRQRGIVFSSKTPLGSGVCVEADISPYALQTENRNANKGHARSFQQKGVDLHVLVARRSVEHLRRSHSCELRTS